MANLDSENKRRSATGIFGFYTIPPAPDSTIDENDRMQATYLYSGIDPQTSIPGYWKPQMLLGVYRMKWIS